MSRSLDPIDPGMDAFGNVTRGTFIEVESFGNYVVTNRVDITNNFKVTGAGATFTKDQWSDMGIFTYPSKYVPLQPSKEEG